MKIVVPEGMLKAAVKAMRLSAESGGKFKSTEQWAEIGLEAAVRWLSENPIVPTDEQHWDIQSAGQIQERVQGAPSYQGYVAEWQRRMFLAPEPEPEIKHLLWSSNPYPNTGAEYRHDEAVKEAYRLGQKSK